MSYQKRRKKGNLGEFIKNYPLPSPARSLSIKKRKRIKRLNEWKPKTVLNPGVRLAKELINDSLPDSQNFDINSYFEKMPDFYYNQDKKSGKIFEDWRLAEPSDRNGLRCDKNFALAFYLPYSFEHSSDKMPWGIYFRLDRIDKDFRRFLSICPLTGFIETASIFNLYITTIFWHELTHHVLEDVAQLKGEDHELNFREYKSNKSFEEGFSEYNAFLVSENGSEIPEKCKIELLEKTTPCIEENVRLILLEYLYYHWCREDKSNPYHPVVQPEYKIKVNDLFANIWDSHLKGNFVLKLPSDVYHRIYYTKDRLV